jgi:hypothetical protein
MLMGCFPGEQKIQNSKLLDASALCPQFVAAGILPAVSGGILPRGPKSEPTS